MRNPIAISLSPNTEKKDVFLTLKILLKPWRIINGQQIKLLEQWFRNYFKISYAISFNSGRGAFYAILRSLELQKEDEIIIQSFTCVVVPNMIIAAGLKPVFVDIDNSLNIDIDDLKKKITQNTKAIVVQHTFGIPADMKKIVRIAKEHNLYIIEDCAHTIGYSYENKKVGTFGIASFFSFGRDKAFSSVFGGMAITNNLIIGKKIRNFQKQKHSPSLFWTIQQLFHPIAFSFILPLYDFLKIGKIVLVVLQKIKLLSFPVSQNEKKGRADKQLIKKMPNALAYLALFQLKRLQEFNNKRVKISEYYINELKNENLSFPYNGRIPYLRFPILFDKRDGLLNFFKKNKIYLGKWYSNMIDPVGVDLRSINYSKNFYPKSEYIAKKIVNLPTYPQMEISDAKKIIKLIKEYDNN